VASAHGHGAGVGSSTALTVAGLSGVQSRIETVSLLDSTRPARQDHGRACVLSRTKAITSILRMLVANDDDLHRAGLGACSFPPQSSGGGGDDDADVQVDAVVVATRCDAPAAFDFGLTPASTIFVASGGSGSPDGTIANPYGVAVPETPGTLDGDCRPDPPSIGPDEPAPGC